VILVGVRVQLKPAGEIALVSATVPANPFRGATVRVDEALPPAKVTELGLALTVKSTTWKVAVAE
jgi:hypothetical protein